jgi:hypothetical protein
MHTVTDREPCQNTCLLAVSPNPIAHLVTILEQQSILPTFRPLATLVELVP